MRQTEQLSLLYIGAVVPDEPEYQTPAFSRAGNMCQLSLLKGFQNAGLTPEDILSIRPICSFPGSGQILVAGHKAVADNSVNINCFPFLNITPLKQFTIGIVTFCAIIKWGLSIRNKPRRVIYTFNITNPPGFFTLLGARLTGSKCVAMIYDINVPGETLPATLLIKLDYWLHKILLPAFDGLVVITNSISEDFARNVPFIRVEGGINDELVQRYSAVDRGNCPKQDKPFKIVTAGSLEEANGILVILDAFSLLNRPDFELHVLGSGPLEGVVRKAALNDQRIVYHGFIPFEKVLEVYDEADVLLNVRLTKNMNTKYFFPSKIMECLTSGIPVITTCPGHVAEEYAEFAFLLKEEDPETLAQMIEYVSLLPEDDRRDLANKARNFMLQNKTWNVQAQRIICFFESLFCL